MGYNKPTHIYIFNTCNIAISFLVQWRAENIEKQETAIWYSLGKTHQWVIQRHKITLVTVVIQTSI